MLTFVINTVVLEGVPKRWFIKGTYSKLTWWCSLKIIVNPQYKSMLLNGSGVLVNRLTGYICLDRKNNLWTKPILRLMVSSWCWHDSWQNKHNSMLDITVSSLAYGTLDNTNISLTSCTYQLDSSFLSWRHKTISRENYLFLDKGTLVVMQIMSLRQRQKKWFDIVKEVQNVLRSRLARLTVKGLQSVYWVWHRRTWSASHLQQWVFLCSHAGDMTLGLAVFVSPPLWSWLKHLNNYQMDCHRRIFHRHSCFIEDKSYCLMSMRLDSIGPYSSPCMRSN